MDEEFEKPPKSKRGILAVLVILFVVIVAIILIMLYPALESPLSNLEELKVNVSFKGDIALSSTESNYSIETFYIETYANALERKAQEVLRVGASHAYTAKQDEWGNEVLLLNIESPEIGKNEYEIWSIIRTEQSTPAFKEGETIPLAYTSPSEYVQSNNRAITELANEITAQAESKYEEAVAITKWVNRNIEYDLSVENVTKDALWVLENRIGVCVEYSHLELALLRARNIPARLVYGVAPYEFPEGWRPHSWVEAYIDNAWVPFDPTWNELGTLDAAHISFAIVPDQGYVTEKTELTGIHLKIDYMMAPELGIEILETKFKEKSIFSDLF